MKVFGAYNIILTLIAMGAVCGTKVTPAAGQEFVFEWAISRGGTADDNVNDIKVDSEGNVHVAGDLRGIVDFDPGSGTAIRTSNGGEDPFIAKFDRQGNNLWAKSFGSGDNDNGVGCAVDSSGSVYLCGRFSGTVNFDPDGAGDTHSSSGNSDAFLTKYDMDGVYQWTRIWGSGDGDGALRVTTDTGGNVYVVGQFRSTVDFDPGLGSDDHTSNGGSDWFLTKLDGNGNYQWAVTVGGNANDSAQGIVGGNAGAVYVTGDYQNTADFDPGIGVQLCTSTGDRDAFLAKYDSSGNLVWVRCFGGTDHDEPRELGIDAFGNLYVTGEFRDTVDFDAGPGIDSHSSQGLEDAFFSKYDDGGNYKYTRTAGGIDSDVGIGVTVDASGTVYFSGGFSDTVDFDPGSGMDEFTSQGSRDGFLCKYDDSGIYLETSVVASTGLDLFRGTGFDSLGNIYLAGSFSDTADLDITSGMDNHASTGGTDIFISRLTAGACANRGDLNNDGIVDGGDIQLFVNKLLSQ